MLLTDSDFSKTSFNSSRVPAPWNNPGGAFDGRSARGYWPNFEVGTATAHNYIRPVNGTPALTSVAPNRATNLEAFLDLNRFGFASPDVERGNAYLAGEYDLTDTLTAFTELGCYQVDECGWCSTPYRYAEYSEHYSNDCGWTLP